MFRALARELAAVRALDSKEFFEATEFYQRVRKRVRRPIMIDLACGHGLVGLLFACLERVVEKVTYATCVCMCVRVCIHVYVYVMYIRVYMESVFDEVCVFDEVFHVSMYVLGDSGRRAAT